MGHGEAVIIPYHTANTYLMMPLRRANRNDIIHYMHNRSPDEILHPCLWGANINSLDIQSDKFLIIERVLEHGGDEQVRFVMETYSKDDIIQVVKESSYLTPKTVNYWCMFFGLKKENTRCFIRPFLHPWPPS